MTDDKLGTPSPKELTQARLTLHWALQLVAAAGAALVPKKPDDSHTATEYIVDRSLLTGAPTDTPQKLRVALALTDLRLVLLDKTLAEVNEFELSGKTLSDALAWLNDTFSATSTLPDYDMPAHAAQDGEAFSQEPAGQAEIARWLAHAASVLEGMEDYDVYCWPHHFDIAVLQPQGDDKSVGVGLSLGDANYDEPYWYVTPWPYPTDSDRPHLPAGHWHGKGFVAAVLTGSEIVEKDNAAAQTEWVEQFLASAIAGAKALVEKA